MWEVGPGAYSQWHTRAVGVVEAIERWGISHDHRDTNAIIAIWEASQ